MGKGQEKGHCCQSQGQDGFVGSVTVKGSFLAVELQVSVMAKFHYG